MADKPRNHNNGNVSHDKNDYSESCDAKGEIKEWMSVNRKLRRQGLTSVRVLPSQDVDMQSGRYVCLDLDSSSSLRTSVSSIISELDHKENIIQDLTRTITSLQEEISELTEQSAMATSKAKDIKVMLECSRARVQELESQQSHSTSAQGLANDEAERLRNTKQAMSRQSRQLDARVKDQDKELDRLRREITLLVEENEMRLKRQNKVFSEFTKRAPRLQSPNDQRLLDIIDSYERQVGDLQKRLNGNRQDPVIGNSDTHLNHSSNNFKTIMKSYERQLRDKDKQIHCLQSEKDSVRHDLGTRPETCDYRVLAQRVKKLERLLCLHNISIPGENNLKDPFASRKKFSTCLDDLDYLPLEQSHSFLKAICNELQVDNVDCIVPVIQEIREEGSSYTRFMDYCHQLSDIVESVSEAHQYRSRCIRGERNMEAVLCDSNMRYYLEVVSNWCKDITCLGSLQDAINHLLDRAVPWMRAQMTTDHSVADMVELLERVNHHHLDRAPCPKTLMEDVNRACLEELVSHFQMLFDTPRISGVLPRMNEVYRVLGELKNVQNTLKTQLGLPEEAHSSALVDAVGKICHMHNSTTAKQLKRLLQTDDLNGVIRRLDEHTQFFPAFHCITRKLFDILGVDRMDELIPAVRALKLLAK